MSNGYNFERYSFQLRASNNVNFTLKNKILLFPGNLGDGFREKIFKIQLINAIFLIKHHKTRITEELLFEPLFISFHR